MKMYKNPEELEALKKEIKKVVPFSMRGYFMAYLFVKNAGKPASTANTHRAQRPNTEGAVSFYINIGKASHASLKELTAFVCNTAGISNEDIVSVAFKQNYSFVYIKKEKSEGIIEKVSGQSFKGRKVKMNFSKESGSEQ